MLLELSIELDYLGQRIDAVYNGIGGKTPSQMSRLERSFASDRMLSFSKESTQPLAIFLGMSLRLTRESLDKLAIKRPVRPVR